MEVISLGPTESLEAVAQLLHTSHRGRRILFERHDYAYMAYPLAVLRPRRKRPCRRRAANERDELAAPHHSITSSARASNEDGTSRPSAFATFRLMTIS